MAAIGGAQQGDRTVLDGLLAVRHTLRSCERGEASTAAGAGGGGGGGAAVAAAAASAAPVTATATLEKVAAAARVAAKAVKAMPAGLGRSGYLEDEAVLGKEEPGCEVLALLLEEAAKV